MKTRTEIKNMFVQKMYYRAIRNNVDITHYEKAMWSLKAILLANKYFAIFCHVD